METPTTESSETNYSLLAKKHFGANFHGESSEPAPQVTDDGGDDAIRKEAQEESQEVTETPDEAAEETTQASESEESPDESLSSDSEESDTVSSFEELVETQEWEPDWANSLTTKVKVDGEEKPVSLQDLKKSYQIQQAAEKRLEEAKSIKEQAKAESAKQAEQAKAQLIQSAKIIEQAEKFLQSDIDNTNLDELKKLDPAEWSAKKLEIQEKRAALNELKQSALREYQAAITQNQEEARQALQETLQEEGRLLMEKIPEWSDEETATSQKSEVAKYLVDLGFSEQEIAQAYDHRMIVLARKAMLHDKGLKSIEPAKKKLKKVVKTIPPGSKKSASETNAQRQNALRSRLKKTGSLDDAAALLGIKR